MTTTLTDYQNNILSERVYNVDYKKNGNNAITTYTVIKYNASHKYKVINVLDDQET